MKEIEERLRRLRTQVEDELKAYVSEHILNQAQMGVYESVKRVVLPVGRACAGADDRLGLELKLTELRAFLDTNPKEREVHKQLLELEAIAKLRTASLSEVFVEKRSGKTGRIDIWARPTDVHELGRIIELKRPSLKLICYKRFQRASTPLKLAIRQVGEYQESKLLVHDKNGVFEHTDFTDMRKTIVAGRKLPLPGTYLLIAEEESAESVDIYSWDAWIDRFERIYT